MLKGNATVELYQQKEVCLKSSIKDEVAYRRGRVVMSHVVVACVERMLQPCARTSPKALNLYAILIADFFHSSSYSTV